MTTYLYYVYITMIENVFVVYTIYYIFSEKLFMAMADHMVSDGFRDAGYEYISVDVSVPVLL